MWIGVSPTAQTFSPVKGVFVSLAVELEQGGMSEQMHACMSGQVSE